jgi:hypothetical protein
MFCSACGQQVADGSGFCSRCGARFAVPGSAAPTDSASPVPSAAWNAAWIANKAAWAFIQAGPKAWLGAAILVLAIVLCFRTGNETTPAAPRTESNQAHGGGAPSTPENTVRAKPHDAPDDSEEQFLNDARKTAREKYISDMHEEFFNSGVEASIRDENGQLVINSDTLKLKNDRDFLMQQVFPAATRRKFCEIGFKTVNLRSGVFSDSYVYSMGCPETKEEKEMRLQQERAARQTFVNNVKNRFNNDPYTKELQIADINNEVVVTYPPSKYTSPEKFRDMIAAGFSKENLCKIGFKGLRVRAGAKGSGTFTSFGCRNVATQ